MNKKCYKLLHLVEIDSGSNQSIDKICLLAFLLGMRQGSAIGILKLCRLEPSGVLKFCYKQNTVQMKPLIFSCRNAMNKQCAFPQYSMPLVKQRST